MRTCTACQAQFYDDGNTLCPRCDAHYTSQQPGYPRGTYERILALRERSQAEAKAATPIDKAIASLKAMEAPDGFVYLPENDPRNRR